MLYSPINNVILMLDSPTKWEENTETINKLQILLPFLMIPLIKCMLNKSQTNKKWIKVRICLKKYFFTDNIKSVEFSVSVKRNIKQKIITTTKTYMNI